MIRSAFARPAPGSAEVRTLSRGDLFDLRIDREALVWVDLFQPTADDCDFLRQVVHAHPLAIEDVARRHQRPKVDRYGDHYFVVLYAARLDSSTKDITTSELQFFWGPSFLVTVHDDPFPELDDLTRLFQDGKSAEAPDGPDHPLTSGDLVYRLVDALFDDYFLAVDSVAEESEDLEEQMFGAGGSGALQRIFTLKKEVLQLRKVTAPSREVVNVFLRRDLPVYPDALQPFFQDAYDHVVRVIDTLDTYRDLLSTSLDVYLSVASNNVNQAVKRMTAVTAILMVDALVAGIYGMNFQNMPELAWTYGYPFSLGLMAAASIGLWLLFRRIDWL